ncbi:phosphotransferase, partial [Oryctes borbonicus]
MSNSELLSPGENIRPQLTLDDARQLVTKLYGFPCKSICELDGYDDKNFKVTINGSQHSDSDKEEEYVLKILNSLDSRKVDVIEGQNELLLYLSNNNISCPIPIQTVTNSYHSIEKLESGNHIVRLMKFISGITLLKVPDPPPCLFRQIGMFVANLDQIMKKFHNPVYDSHRTIWMMESVPDLKKFLFAVKDRDRRCIVEEIIEEFEEKVLTTVDKLDKGMIHGDFNEQNILVEKIDDEWRMKSILDFGDSQHSCYLFELAITMAYVMILRRCMNAGGHVLGGFQKVRKVPEEELNLLKICIEARICQSLVM